MLPFSEIDALRAKAGIDKKELAEAARLTPQAYSKFGNAKRGPTEGTLIRLYDALMGFEAVRTLISQK